MEFLHSYLEIERIRFRDRLTTSVEVIRPAGCSRPESDLAAHCRKRMRHAVATHAHAGRIEITGRCSQWLFTNSSQRYGPGLAINQILVNQIGKGVGLSNTKARLERLYGTEHLLELANDPQGGLVVTLEIPRRISSEIRVVKDGVSIPIEAPV